MARTARADSMAKIDAALSSPGGGGGAAPPGEDSPVVIAPHAAPGVNPPTPIASTLTADQKRAIDVARQERMDNERAQKDIVLAQEQALQKQQQERIDNESAVKRSALATWAAMKQIGKGTAVRLERLPNPGGITFPLVVLLIFFFLLLPANGHTRAMWIWLVLTGNASIGGGTGAQIVGGTAATGAISPPTTGSTNTGATGSTNTGATGTGATGTGGTPVQTAINAAISGIALSFAGNEHPS